MKKLLTSIGLMLAVATASAADVNAVLTVSYKGVPVYQTTNSFFNITDAEAKELQTSGMKQLDFASKQQDKGGPYTITWKWNNEPAIQTAGMTFGAVNATLRQGSKWLDTQLGKAEKAEKAGKAKPFGN